MSDRAQAALRHMRAGGPEAEIRLLRGLYFLYLPFLTTVQVGRDAFLELGPFIVPQKNGAWRLRTPKKVSQDAIGTSAPRPTEGPEAQGVGGGL